MQSIIAELKEALTTAIHLLYPAFPDAAEVTVSTQEQFGDFQCNSAMKLSKWAKKSSRAIAEEIIPHVNLRMIQKMEVAGPGFINIWLDPHFTTRHLNQMLHDERLLIPKPAKPKKIIVEFSSPNIAKEMHVGHLRSTIIGEVIARLFEFQGHDVLRLNHLGDWGTAFGMLIAYMKEAGADLQTADLQSLVRYYRESKKRFDEDEAFKKRSQLEVVKLQSGEKESLHVWQTICAISNKAYKEIYDLLDIKLQDRGESFYNPFLAPMIADLEKRGLIQISEGAKCIFLEGFKNREGEPLPLMVQKSDGGYNYDTTDLAAIRYRVQEDKAERIVVVTDAGQITHFLMEFQAAEKAGYLDRTKVRMDHVPFGLVLGPDGKKFKTRSGETERLVDLIETAITKAGEILRQRAADLSEEEVKETALVLGVNAIKYADLSSERTQDYQFSYERMLRFEGNTAAFLMYAYVRILGIQRKSGKKEGEIHLEHPTEFALGKHLLRFHETIDNLAEELYPHRLADYLYQLAEKFHAFFRDCPVIDSPQEAQRLALIALTGRVLKLGMFLLGLKTVNRM